MTGRARRAGGAALALAGALGLAACGVYGPPRRPEPSGPAGSAAAAQPAPPGGEAPAPEDASDGR